MFYEKTNIVGELNTDHIRVGNWSSKAEIAVGVIVGSQGLPIPTGEY